MAKTNKKGEYFDLKALLAKFASKWYWFVISAVICVGIAFLYTKRSHPVYGVRANIMISTGDESPTALFGSLSDILGGSGRVNDEIYVLASHSLYKEVAKNLGLNVAHYVKTGFLKADFEFRDYPIGLEIPEGISDTLKVPIVFKIKASENGKVNVEVKAKKDVIAKVKDAVFPVTLRTDYGEFVLDKTQNYPVDEEVKSTITLTSYDAVAEVLNDEVLSHIADRKSNVIKLEYNTPYPGYGMAVINELVAAYNKRGIKEKNIQGSHTSQFIDERLKLLSTDLSAAEGEIQNYKQREGFVDLTTEIKYQNEKKGEVESSLIQAETNAEVLKMISAFIDNPENANTLVPFTIDNEGLKGAITTYNNLLLKRMDLMNNARPNNSTLRLLDDQIAAMRSNINISIGKAYDTQMIAINELKSAQKAANQRLENIPTQEREYRDLLRQQNIKQELFVYLLQRREEASLLLANAIPKGVIIDEAFTLINPLSTDRKVIWFIGLIIGLIIPVVIISLKDLLNDKFTTTDDLKKFTDVPVIGEICSDKSAQSIVVKRHDSSSTSELFRLMRSTLQFIMDDESDKVVLVTSTKSGEGKSFISVNLAAAMAMVENKKVLLVGLDIRKPRLASYLGINPKYGLTQYLSSSSVTFDQLVTHSSEDDMPDVIVAGPIPPNPSEMLQSRKLEQFFEEARKRYDYIFVDSAPIGMVSDTFSLKKYTDATIIVARANFTSRRDIEFVNEVYDQKRLNKISIALNGTTLRKGYGYGYSDKQTGQQF